MAAQSGQQQPATQVLPQLLQWFGNHRAAQYARRLRAVETRRVIQRPPKRSQADAVRCSFCGSDNIRPQHRVIAEEMQCGVITGGIDPAGTQFGAPGLQCVRHGGQGLDPSRLGQLLDVEESGRDWRGVVLDPPAGSLGEMRHAPGIASVEASVTDDALAETPAPAAAMRAAAAAGSLA